MVFTIIFNVFKALNICIRIKGLLPLKGTGFGVNVLNWLSTSQHWILSRAQGCVPLYLQLYSGNKNSE